MKLKVLFLKKKHIYTAIGVLILILVCLFFVTLFTKKHSLSTFNIMSRDKIFKTDLTGDGEEDFLYVKTKKDKYYLQVNTKDNKTIFIEPEKKLNTLGRYYENWPMRINLKDINRDNTPEIFIQASQNGKAIQHVFMWNRDNFKDIFCGYNNLLGFFDYSNNKTPKFVSGNFKDGKINFSNYILVGKDLRNFDYKCGESFLGKNTIGNFINLICNLSDDKESLKDSLENIAFVNSSSEIVKVLSQMNSKAYNFTFQDGFFKDSRYNTNGEPSEINWLLNFKGELKNSKEVKNYTLSLSLKPSTNKEEEFYFKINNLSLSPLK